MKISNGAKNKKTHLLRQTGGFSGQVKPISEFRQDPVSGDWILLTPFRSVGHKFEGRVRMKLPKSKCPFENPSKFGNKPPVLVYQNETKNDWFLQIIPNKYPAVGPGMGFHEIVIYRDHDRYLANFAEKEIERILLAFQERYRSLAEEKCVEYISIFHNHGKEAGSTVPHPHSQILALPIVPPDISHSLNGSQNYFHKHNKCVHCQMIEDALKEKKRIIYQNKDIVAFAPFVSRTEFEVRVLPKKHSAYFEKAENKELESLAAALKAVFSRIHKNLKDPAFNFFIHTAPTIKNQDYSHYHWHIEILPKFDIFGGFELGTGLEINSIAPEKAAGILKKNA